MISKYFPKGTLILFGAFLLVMLTTYILVQPSPPPSELQGVLRQDYRLLHPFKLKDHRNNVFSEERLQDKWTFVFFGYTSCPDICPATLYVLRTVREMLGDDTAGFPEDMQVVFVSVDPERDSTEMLASYVTHFNKEFIGVTADKAEIDSLVRQFGAGYLVEPGTTPGQYAIAHTSAIFLVDPYGRLVASFSQPHYPATITSQYKSIRGYFFGD